MSYAYKIERVPDGYIVRADGFNTRSLPYGTRDEAVGVITHLCKKHPGSVFVEK